MRDLNDKITGNTLTASEWNDLPSEVQNIIEAVGQTLSSGDLNQLGKAISDYVANASFYVDSGVADVYVFSVVGSIQSPTAYTNGMMCRALITNVNTGASTVNVAGLGIKQIRDADGNVLVSGELDGYVQMVYNSASGHFRLLGATGYITTIPEGGTGATTASGARTNLGVGTGDTPAFNGISVTNPISMADNELRRPKIRDYGVNHHVETSSAGVLNIDMTLGNSVIYTFTENITDIVISNPPASGTYGEINLMLVQHASAAKTISWPAKYKFTLGNDHVMTTTLSAIDILTLFTVDGGTTWYGAFGRGFS